MYLVGGAVRDKLRQSVALEREPDRDYVVCGLPIESLMNELASLGNCDFVGKSFGVIKFTPDSDCDLFGWHFAKGVSCDIALPRRERSTGVHHRDFDVTFDPSIPIEQDLMRRDFTINAMAMTPDGTIVDPSGGQNDLKQRLLRLVFPNSLAEDPLRILRAAQIAARFDLNLDPILVNSARNISLNEVTPERVREEVVKGLILPIKASTFFRHLAHMDKLSEIMPELLEVNPYWEILYSVLDRSRRINRLLLLYWFLDRHTDELDWYVSHAYNRESIETSRAVDLAKLMWTGDDSVSSGEVKSAGYRLFTRLRFSNKDIGNAITFSTYSFRIPESLLRKRTSSISPIIRWTLKAVHDEGLVMEHFLSASQSLFESIYDQVQEEWEDELYEVDFFLENPPINGKRLIELGFKPGILIGDILNAVSGAHDRGEVENSAQAEMFVLAKFGDRRNLQ